jgi:ribosome-associated protein
MYEMERPNPAIPRAVIVRDTPIELCQFIKFSGLAGSGGEAKQLIAEGKVLVNGIEETRKRKKLMPGDTVNLDGQTLVVQVG